jgi:hypothetical protein
MPSNASKWKSLNWPMQGCMSDIHLKTMEHYSSLFMDLEEATLRSYLAHDTDWMTAIYKSYDFSKLSLYNCNNKFWIEDHTPKKDKPMATTNTVTYWILVKTKDTNLASWTYYADRATLVDADSLASSLVSDGTYAKAMVAKACSLMEAPVVKVTKYA